MTTEDFLSRWCPTGGKDRQWFRDDLRTLLLSNRSSVLNEAYEISLHHKCAGRGCDCQGQIMWAIVGAMEKRDGSKEVEGGK